jgi:hypothetical protein
MKTRQTTIQANKAFGTAGTETIPIYIKDPISRILIPFGLTVGAGARLAHISSVFSKIEIVDGSDVLMSLTGRQIDGIAHMDAIASSATFSSNNINSEDWGNLVIDFGRYLYDKVLAFDPSKFMNPQLKITYATATPQAAATAVEFAVLAYIMEGLSANPMGFLMKKEAKSWTAAASNWEYTQLARDYIYRRLWIQGLTDAIGVGAHWSRAVLQEENYKRVPIDSLVDDQVADNAHRYGLITEGCGGRLSVITYPVFAAPCYGSSLSAKCTAATSAMAAVSMDGGEYRVATSGGSDNWSGLAVGHCPHGLVVFDLGPKDIIEDWYDPRPLGSLQLEIYGAGAYTIHLVTEQLRTY